MGVCRWFAVGGALVSVCGLASVVMASDDVGFDDDAAIVSTSDARTGTVAVGNRILPTTPVPPTPPPIIPETPEMFTLTGSVRDFAEASAAGGHPDFELYPSGGFGQYVGIVHDELDSDFKPAFRSRGQGIGWSITDQFRDAAGRPIIPFKSYIEQRPGDVAGVINPQMTGAVTGADRFRQWFRDTPGVNASSALSITLVRDNATGLYVFDDTDDPRFQSLGGFFPINGQLLGNSAGENRNFHFTYELNTVFTYQRRGDIFRFIGDDDVWVFIDGKLVIDIGGIHAAVQQTIDLDRLTWLQEGQTYDLRFFFAERHRTQSNFRIETSLALRTVEPPQVSEAFD